MLLADQVSEFTLLARWQLRHGFPDFREEFFTSLCGGGLFAAQFFNLLGQVRHRFGQSSD